MLLLSHTMPSVGMDTQQVPQKAADEWISFYLISK